MFLIIPNICIKPPLKNITIKIIKTPLKIFEILYSLGIPSAFWILSNKNGWDPKIITVPPRDAQTDLEPPITTAARIFNDSIISQSAGAHFCIKILWKNPAIPANTVEITKANNLCLNKPIPIACAAEVEFFIDRKALPSGEIIIFVVIRVIIITANTINKYIVILVCVTTPINGVKFLVDTLIKSNPSAISVTISIKKRYKISAKPKVTIAK